MQFDAREKLAKHAIARKGNSNRPGRNVFQHVSPAAALRGTVKRKRPFQRNAR
jgi:hypothetical protein